MPRTKSNPDMSYEATKSLAETYRSLASAATTPHLHSRLTKTAEKFEAQARLLRPEPGPGDIGATQHPLE